MCFRVSLLYSDTVYCFHSITVSPSLRDRYFPRHFVPLPLQAGGRCYHGPVSPSDECGHRLHRFLQGLEPGPLLGQAARWATSLSEAIRPLCIISALPSLTNRLLPPALLYRLGSPLQNEMSLKMECQSKWNVTQNGMSLKMKGHSKWDVTQNEMSLKMECHLKWNITQNGMSLKMECHSKWNVTQNGMVLKMECHSNWNVTLNRMSLKTEYHSNWNVTQTGMSLKMECHLK